MIINLEKLSMDFDWEDYQKDCMDENHTYVCVCCGAFFLRSWGLCKECCKTVKINKSEDGINNLK